MPDANVWQRKAEREAAARRQAEDLLESKSRELFEVNTALGLSRDSLEKVVQERTASLRQAIEKLEQEIKLRSQVEEELRQSRDSALALANMKSEFLARMSHEIHTPLNTVVGLTELVLATTLTDQQRRKVGMVYDSSRKLLAIISNVLDLSEIDAGLLTLSYEKVSIKQVVDECIAKVAGDAEAKGINFEVTQQYSMPEFVFLDGHRTQQILLNLLSNAVKYSSSGTVAVKVQLVPPLKKPEEIPATLSGISEMNSLPIYTLQISVKDKGRGFLPGNLDKLFKPFTSLDSATLGSTGLGLSVSKRLCELMGGNISAESAYEAGSTFTFEVLCCAIGAGKSLQAKAPEKLIYNGDRPDPMSSTAAQEKLSGKRIKAIGTEMPLSILLADDFEMNRLVQLYQLEQLGYRADVVTNGEEVLRALAAKSFDVVLMDIRMPVLDGVSTTQRIRNSKDLPQPYIIAVTASALEKDKQTFHDVGINYYVPKPVEIEQLAAALIRAYEDKVAKADQPVMPQVLKAPSEMVINMEGVYERLGPSAPQLLKRVIPVYIREMPSREAKLRQSLSEGNHEEFGRICHGLKSSSRSIGADLLADNFSDLESECLEGRLPTEKALDRVLQLADHVIRSLDQQLGKL